MNWQLHQQLRESDPFQGGFEAINSALSNVDRKRVKGIGISGQQHGFVPVDKKGEVLLTFSASCLMILALSILQWK